MKEITTSCIFTNTCYDSNFNIKSVKEHSSFDEYELNLAYFQFKNFLNWYSYLFHATNISFHFDETDKKIHWFISNYSDNNFDEYYQYFNNVNEILNELHIACEVDIETKRSWILTVKLIIDAKKRKRR